MSIADLIKGRVDPKIFPVGVATAKAAIPATDTSLNTPDVAQIAKVHVAAPLGGEKDCSRNSKNSSSRGFENADFAERVAILIESGGHSPDTAQRLATNDLGGEQLVQWRYHIERLPIAITTKGSQLIKTATAFLNSPMAAMAAYYGWDDWEVFGVLNGPPRAMVRRHDAMGLVPAVAWSRIGSKLVDIDCDRAIIETYTHNTHNTLTYKRPLTGRRYTVPVWWSEIMKEKQNDR